MIDKEKKKVIEILKKHGVKMKLGGCGCCGSPWLKFEYNGVTILDDDEVHFDMFERKEK